jgi:hypothetical protein
VEMCEDSLLATVAAVAVAARLFGLSLLPYKSERSKSSFLRPLRAEPPSALPPPPPPALSPPPPLLSDASRAFRSARHSALVFLPAAVVAFVCKFSRPTRPQNLSFHFLSCCYRKAKETTNMSVRKVFEIITKLESNVCHNFDDLVAAS